MDAAPCQVTLDDERYPGKTIVVVEEPGLVVQWPFHERWHAEQRASAEEERLKSEFPA